MTSLWRILVSCSIVAVAVARADEPPSAVSPGSADRVVVAASRCPTFSWGPVQDAPGFELAVFAIADDGAVATEPILVERVEGGALSWTPPLARCLPPGGTYAWTVRALGEAGEGGWSEARLFRVLAPPSAERLRESFPIPADRHLVEQTTGGDAAAARRSDAEVEPILVLPLDPSVQLDGDMVVDGGVFYLTPRTRKVRLGVPDFIFGGHDLDLVRDANELWITSASFKNVAYAPVHTIPDGAEVTDFECFILDRSSAHDVQCSLLFSVSDLGAIGNWTAGSGVMDSDPAYRTITDPTGIPFLVGGNERLWVEFRVSSPLCDWNCRLGSATITYTLNQVD